MVVHQKSIKQYVQKKSRVKNGQRLVKNGFLQDYDRNIVDTNMTLIYSFSTTGIYYMPNIVLGAENIPINSGNQNIPLQILN